MKKREHRSIAMIFLLIIFFCAPVFAHKVILYTYIDGDLIAAEGGFSDGSPAKNAELKVYDFKKNLLYTGKTDEQGLHRFPIPKRCDLRVVLNAGLGHVAEQTILQGDLPVFSDKSDQHTSIDEQNLRLIIREELAPLAKKLAQLERKGPGINEIIGGIGYILGLMGIVLYFRSKRNDQK